MKSDDEKNEALLDDHEDIEELMNSFKNSQKSKNYEFVFVLNEILPPV